MKHQLKFNINDEVLIKPTIEGLEMLVKDWNILAEGTGLEKRTLKYYIDKLDHNGYLKMQLYDVMRHFGHKLYNGSIALPMETNIKIPIKVELTS